ERTACILGFPVSPWHSQTGCRHKPEYSKQYIFLSCCHSLHKCKIHMCKNSYISKNIFLNLFRQQYLLIIIAVIAQTKKRLLITGSLPCSVTAFMCSRTTCRADQRFVMKRAKP